MKQYTKNKELVLSLTSWLLSMAVFDGILFALQDNPSETFTRLFSIALLIILGLGFLSFCIFVVELDKIFQKQFSKIFAVGLTTLSFFFFIALGIGLISSPFLLINKKVTPTENTIVDSNKYTLISSGLKNGSTGDDVKIIQAAFSIDSDIYPSGSITGYYGNLTYDAVINFQKRYSLSQTGEFDESTTHKFNELYGSKTRSYYLGLAPTVINYPNNTDNSKQELPTNNDPYGVVKQISEHTFTQRLGADTKMGTPQELLIAINDFRSKNNLAPLIWNDNLANWAQSRAQTFANINNVDEHAGFNAEVETKYHEFGEQFNKLGENAGFGPRLEAVHEIEWVFAGDQPHRDNMLRDWSHVGIAIASSDGANYGVDFIFGKSR